VAGGGRTGSTAPERSGVRAGRRPGRGEHHTSTAPSTSARARADASRDSSRGSLRNAALARPLRRGMGAGVPRHPSHGLRFPLLPHPPRRGPGAPQRQPGRPHLPPPPALRAPGPAGSAAPLHAAAQGPGRRPPAPGSPHRPGGGALRPCLPPGPLRGLRFFCGDRVGWASKRQGALRSERGGWRRPTTGTSPVPTGVSPSRQGADLVLAGVCGNLLKPGVGCLPGRERSRCSTNSSSALLRPLEGIRRTPTSPEAPRGRHRTPQGYAISGSPGGASQPVPSHHRASQPRPPPPGQRLTHTDQTTSDRDCGGLSYSGRKSEAGPGVRRPEAFFVEHP
jgi:hypothetical protein